MTEGIFSDALKGRAAAPEDFTEPGFKWRYYTPSLVVDGAANKFLAYVLPKGAIAEVVVRKQVAAGGTWAAIRTIPTPATDKADHVGIVQSGANLHLFYSTHQGDTACTMHEVVLLGACVPYGSEGPQLGMPGAFVPEEGGGGEPQVDYEQVRVIMREESLRAINDFDARLGGQGPREDIEGKVKDAVRELNLWSESLQDRGLDQYIKDRLYECLTENWPEQFPEVGGTK